jgi:hypothetical protein
MHLGLSKPVDLPAEAGCERHSKPGAEAMVPAADETRSLKGAGGRNS